MFGRFELVELLHDYVAGDLDAAGARALEERIAREPKVRELYDEIRETHEALQCLKNRPEPPYSASDVLPHIQAAIGRRQFESRPELLMEGQGLRFYRRLAIAATLLCALTVGTLVVNGLSTPDPEPLPAAVTPDRPTARGRGLLPFVEAGSRGAMNGVEFIELLVETGRRPDDVRFTPNDQVVPVSRISAVER